MSRSTPFRAAVVQDAPAAFDLPTSLDHALALIAQAAGQGAQLVVFPEAFLGGYPKGLDFGARVGMRSPEGRDLFRRYYEGALDVPGPATAALGAAASAHSLHLVIGVIERAGGTLYCTVLFFGPDGTLLGTHRKVMPTAMERLIWGFGDGSTLQVLPTPLGRIGAAICWENYSRSCAWHSTARASSSTARQRLMIARPGCRQCATSRWKGAVSCSRRASSLAAATFHLTSPPSRATTRRPCSFAAGAASLARWARCSPAQCSTRRPS